MNNKKITLNEAFASGLKNHQLNKFKDAENFYKYVLKKAPKHFGSVFYLGTLFLQTNKFGLAKRLLQKAIQIKPDFVEAYNNLGATLKELGEYKEATKYLQKAIQIKPEYVDARNNLGAVLNILGEYQQAKNHLEKAIQIQPGFLSSYKNLALTFQELGDTKQEINCFKKLAESEKKPAEAYHNLARLSVVLGDIHKAAEYYKKAIKHDPENLTYYYHLSDLDKKFLNLVFTKKINKIIKNTNSTKKNLAYGNFLLANYESGLKNYEKEFNYLLKGHQNFLESNVYNFKKEINYWLNLLPKYEDLYNINNSKKAIKEASHTIQPIFIIGVPRCGSTLIEKIISSGEKSIPMGEETGIISSFVKRKIMNKESLSFEIENFQIDLLKKYKERNLINSNSNYTFTDKTLDNFFYVALIKKVFPKAKIIHCRRSPISSIVSILKNNMPTLYWAHNLDNIFEYFDIYHQTLDRYNKILPNYIYELELEKLSNDPVLESKKLMQYCNLPWSKKCLEFHKRKDLISRTTSNLQVRKAVYKHQTNEDNPYKTFFKKYENKYTWFK